MQTTSMVRRAAKVAVLPLGTILRRKAGDVLVLLYHRVGAGGREVDVELESFDLQMEELSSAHRVLSLDEALDDRTRGDGGVVVTFDDGFADFSERALPVLVRHGIPAVLYLATGLVRVERGPFSAGDHLLSWNDLADCVATGLVTVGSHTHTHPDLSAAPEILAAHEMRRSKELIEDRLGIACRHFAYPFAVASEGAEHAARRLFDSAALGAWRTNRSGRFDPYRIGRTPVLRSDGAWLFRAKVRGWLEGESVPYRLARRGPWSANRPGDGMGAPEAPGDAVAAGGGAEGSGE